MAASSSSSSSSPLLILLLLLLISMSSGGLHVMGCSPGDIVIRQDPVGDSGHGIITRQGGERGEVVVDHEVPSGPNTPIWRLTVANLCPCSSAAIVTLNCPSFSQDWIPSSVMKVDERSSTCQIVNGIPFNFKHEFSVDYQNGQFNENQFSLASLRFIPKSSK